MSKAITDMNIFDEIISLLTQAGRLSPQVEYDGLIVKKMAGSNSSGKEDTSSGQTHIAITGVQMDLFPNLYASSYEDKALEVDNRLPFKGFFTLRIPYHISKLNSDLINTGIEFDGNSELITYGSVVKSYRESSDSHQIELSVKTLDDENFKCFINHLNSNDLLVILKRKKMLEYELLGIKTTDELYNAFLSYESNLYIRFESPVKTKTPVEVNLFENSSRKLNKEIKHPHNRIIFGAPGTGKSFQINKDAKDFGDNYERVTFHPNYSYAQFVGTYKPIMKKKGDSILKENEKEVIRILSDKNIAASEKYKKLYHSDIYISALCALIGLATGETDFSTIKADGSISDKDHTLMSGVGKNMNQYATLKSLDGDSEISYSYIPGPFIRVLEKALYSQQMEENKPYLLIIEEINRANVAAVFGDVFQLLDRDEHNESQYEIDVSEDLYNYLTSEDNEQTGHKKLNIGKKLKIPSNMYIWATMNSADQGVQPMDAAFKRRWDFEYLPLDENEKEIANYQLSFPEKDNGYQLQYWKDVRFKINELLRKVGNVNEDKLLGPFFISKNILDKYNNQKDVKIAKEFADLFKSKVLMYLYEDVCKINPSVVFKNVKSKTGTGKVHFSDICNTFDEIGIGIFEE